MPRSIRVRVIAAVAATGAMLASAAAIPAHAQPAPGSIDILGVTPDMTVSDARATLQRQFPRVREDAHETTLSSDRTSWRYQSKVSFILAYNGVAPDDQVDAILQPKSDTLLAVHRFKHFMLSTQLLSTLADALIKKYGAPTHVYGLDDRSPNSIMIWADGVPTATAEMRFSPRESSPAWQHCRFRAESYAGDESVSTTMNYIASNNVLTEGESRCGRVVVAEIVRELDRAYVSSVSLYAVDLAQSHERMQRLAAEFFNQAENERRQQLQKDSANSTPF